MTSEAVYTFLKNENRPYSVGDILQRLGDIHGKSSVQKTLDKLVEKQKVIEKTYGKQKIYCVSQEDDRKKSDIDNSLRAIDQEVNSVTSNLRTIEGTLHSQTLELRNLENQMTTEEATIKKQELKEEIANLKSRLETLSENVQPISKEEKIEVTAEYEKYLKEFKKRKRMCMDIVNTILEGYPKSKQDLLEDIGMETDEDVGFSLDQH